MATPLEINMAIWYRCRAGDYGKDNGDNNYDAPAVQSARLGFFKAGLLALSPPGSEANYYGTDALGVYIDALCSVPLPVQKWVIPDAA